MLNYYEFKLKNTKPAQHQHVCYKHINLLQQHGARITENATTAQGDVHYCLETKAFSQHLNMFRLLSHRDRSLLWAQRKWNFTGWLMCVSW